MGTGGTGGAARCLRENLALETRHYHPAAQAGRFLTAFAAVLLAQVLAGASVAGWADLRALIAGALPVAWRQWRKTILVSRANRVVDEHEQAADAGPAGRAPCGAAGPGP